MLGTGLRKRLEGAGTDMADQPRYADRGDIGCSLQGRLKRRRRPAIGHVRHVDVGTQLQTTSTASCETLPSPAVA